MKEKMQKRGSFCRQIDRINFLRYNPKKKWEEKVRHFKAVYRGMGIDFGYLNWIIN